MKEQLELKREEARRDRKSVRADNVDTLREHSAEHLSFLSVFEKTHQLQTSVMLVAFFHDAADHAGL